MNSNLKLQLELVNDSPKQYEIFRKFNSKSPNINIIPEFSSSLSILPKHTVPQPTRKNSDLLK